MPDTTYRPSDDAQRALELALRNAANRATWQQRYEQASAATERRRHQRVERLRRGFIARRSRRRQHA